MKSKGIILGALAVICSSCAIGSGVSAVSGVSVYSVTSGTARRLDTDTEKLLIMKIKEELYYEMESESPR